MKKTINSTLVMRLWVCILAAIGFASCSDSDEWFDILTQEVEAVYEYTIQTDEYERWESGERGAYYNDYDMGAGTDVYMETTYITKGNTVEITYYDFSVLVNGIEFNRRPVMLADATGWEYYGRFMGSLPGLDWGNDPWGENIKSTYLRIQAKDQQKREVKVTVTKITLVTQLER